MTEGTASNRLEEELRGVTSWEGPAPRMWAKALEASVARRSRFGRAAHVLSAGLRRPSGMAAALLFVALCGVIAASVNAPGARLSRRVSSVETDARAPATLSGKVDGKPAGAATVTSAAEHVQSDEQRVVIRHATVYLESKDVRAVFARIALLVSDATGEYIQDSSLTGGSGEGANREPLAGQLTLRIRVQRLGDVLNSLRELGEVVSESSGGEDVTSQAVDLDARLRNEQRVETELLELLASRNDAPLGEILEVREQIARVRGEIERLGAQRERLTHLASLATVLVIIREPDGTGNDAVLGSYFTSRMAKAWHNGLVSLSDSIGWVLGVLISGALWWLVLLVVAVLVVRALRRALRPGA